MQSQYPVIEAVLMGIRAMKTSPVVVARESYLRAAQRARLRRELRHEPEKNDKEQKGRSGGLHLRHAERISDLFVQFDPHPVRVRQKYFHNLRIKLLSGEFLYLRARRGNRQRLAIRPVRNHGVQRIGPREYSGAQWNLFAFQFPRVP